MNETQNVSGVVQLVNIKLLKANPRNPRIIKDARFKKLVQSLKDFPEMMKLRPIVADEAFVILGGNMRFRAAQDAGWKEVPVIQAHDLTEAQKDEFIVKDNVAFGEWDWDAIMKEWSAVDTENWGLTDVKGWDDIPIGDIEPAVSNASPKAKKDDKVSFDLTPDQKAALMDALALTGSLSAPDALMHIVTFFTKYHTNEPNRN